MRIQSLQINNFRGIINEDLKVNGNNFCVYGPNGVGKSAVADAVDFLFSGRLKRLEGEGTSEVNLRKHGPHVGKSADDAFVKAELKAKDGKTFWVKRVVSNPEKVEINDKYKDIFHEMEEYAKTGAHFLCRKELLKFILSTPSERAGRIQAILDITDVKEKNAYINKSVKEAKKECDELKQYIEKIDNELNNICGKQNHLDSINSWRLSLGAKPISKIESDKIIGELNYKEDISFSKKRNELTVYQNIKDNIEDYKEKILFTDSKIKQIVVELEEVNATSEDLNKLNLLENGIKVLDGSGKCPLCEHQWNNEEELKSILNERIKKGEKTKYLFDEYKKNIDKLIEFFEDLTNLNDGIELDEKNNKSYIEEFFFECDKYSDIQINVGFSEYNKVLLDSINWVNNINEKLIEEECQNRIDNIKKSNLEKEKEKGVAWSNLSQYKLWLDKKEEELIKYNLSKTKCTNINNLSKIFDNAYTNVLNNLYDDIKNRFVEIYRKLHGADEAKFEANMERSRYGVGLTVDFHEQGQFPPVAYHSEGHQDSMGIAIFLALMEKMSVGEKGVVVLDDVVMSVDIEHRLAFCDLLKSEYSDYQFIITTHDEIWEKYLEKHGVISRKNAFYFTNWSVEHGPELIEKKGDIWEECKEKAGVDMNSAAHFLRREMEVYFEEECDKLGADLRYNSERKWDFGQYCNAAYNSLNTQYVKAKEVADKYKNVELLNKVQSKIDSLKAAKTQIDANNWITNNLVHNNEAVFSEQEFECAMNSLKELCSQFECDKCKSKIYYTYSRFKPSVMRCKCGDVLFTLE